MPPEVKINLKAFPKSRSSQPNYRYLDLVKAKTQEFLNNNIKMNYFNGDSKVDLSLSLGEAEVLFNADAEVKSLGENGGIQKMHSECRSLLDQSERLYIEYKDKLEAVVQNIHA